MVTLGSIGQKFIKEELERIWKEEPIAFPGHWAKWVVVGPKKIGIWFWADCFRPILQAIKGKVVRRTAGQVEVEKINKLMRFVKWT
jgi:hypothetical protein